MKLNDNEGFLSDFGGHLRFVRRLRGISQEDLADSAGLDRTYISSVERGKRNISLLNIKKICDALEMSVEDFFKGISDQSDG